MLKPLRPQRNAAWKQRFRAATIAAAQVARSNPARGLVSGTATGQYQLYAWEVGAGNLRQLTHQPGGTAFGAIAPDGRYVYYLEDDGGDEIGHFSRVPWQGGPAEDITPALPPYSAFGLNFSRSGSLMGSVFSDDRGFHALLLPVDQDATVGLPREIHHTDSLMFGPTLSHGGELAVLTSTERTTFQHNGLMAFDASSGKKAGELWESGASLMSFGFSPVPGDLRMLATSNGTGYTRPFIWNPATGTRVDLNLPDFAGDVSPMEWSLDSARILLAQSHMAVQRLLLYDLSTGKTTRLNHPGGFYGLATPFTSATALAADEILIGWQDSTHPPQLVALDGQTGRRTRIVLAADRVPRGPPLAAGDVFVRGRRDDSGLAGFAEGARTIPDDPPHSRGTGDTDR